jgi:hypothetical protein
MPKAGSGRSRIPRAPSLRVISGGQSKAVGRHDADRAAKGKRVQFDPETWHALNMLARDRMMTFAELADEAFRDLLRKHGRPTDLKDALRRSVQDTGPQRPVSRKAGTRHHKE